jgi:uncharacterized protein (TIGR04141 family)
VTADVHEVESGGVTLGRLFVKKRPGKTPAWAALFSHVLAPSLFGTVKSTAAVYFVKVKNRLFALTFGQGRFLLLPDTHEERFGLLVVLNSVEAEKLRSVDKKTFDSIDHNSRVQLSQQAPASQFGIDIEKDLIRSITGTPRKLIWGTRMTGADALSVSVDTTLEKLKPLLSEYLDRFESKDYEGEFAWIDQINQIAPASSKAADLDAALVDRLEQAKVAQKAPERTWLAIPEIIDWQRVYRFQFSTRVGAPSHNDLHWPGFVDSLKQDQSVSLELLHRRAALAVDDQGIIVDSWPIYRCLHCEIEDDGHTYLLSGGRWFRINTGFVASVNDFFSQTLSKYDYQLPVYDHESEEAYNVAVVESDPNEFALMDRKIVRVGGVNDKVEFCDIYTRHKHLIHVKRYGGSSLLGHLFNQGLVSGELLREHEQYVERVNAFLPNDYALGDHAIPRPVSDFVVVFAVISEQSGEDLNIPFFAKVAIKHVHKRLSSLGFTRVEIAKIKVSEVTKKLQKMSGTKATKQ